MARACVNDGSRVQGTIDWTEFACSGRTEGTSIAGCELPEALVSVALMGAIVASLSAVTGQWLPNWRHGFGRVQRLESLDVGLQRLVSDLEVAEFVTPNYAERIAGWRKKANAGGQNPEAGDYKEAGYDYLPRQGPFQNSLELPLVLGIPPTSSSAFCRSSPSAAASRKSISASRRRRWCPPCRT